MGMARVGTDADVAKEGWKPTGKGKIPVEGVPHGA